MDKKDKFIKQRLQQDKQISEQADIIFKNFKGGNVMDNEKKVIKISFGKFLAGVASLVIVTFLGTNLYLNAIDKTNIFNLSKGSPEEIRALEEKEIKNELTDEMAKELFEKGAYEIRYLQYSDPRTGYTMENPPVEKTVNGIPYQKATESYKTVIDKYSEIFTGEALNNVLENKFIDVNGALYCSQVGGMTGWDITNLSVTKTSERNGEYTYKATFNNVEGIDEYEHVEEYLMTSQFTIIKIGEEYRISKIDYLNVDKKESIPDEEINNNATPDDIAKELFEKGSEKLITFAANPAMDVIRTDFGDKVITGEEKAINEGLFYKTTLKYKQAEDKYGEMFMGEALNKLMTKNFLNVDGVLYANAVGGGSGFAIKNLKVSYVSQSNGKYTYKAIFNETEGFDEYETLGPTLTKEFVIERVGNNYKISSIDYIPSI